MRYPEVIQRWRTQVAVAGALRIAQSSVAEWKERGIPYLRQQQLEALSDGDLKADWKHAPKHEWKRYGQSLCRTGKAA